MSERNRFQKKSVVVTGAAAGMGKAITKSFVQEGAVVVAVDRDEQALHTLVEEIEQLRQAGATGYVIPYQ